MGLDDTEQSEHQLENGQPPQEHQSPDELREEARKLRRLQMMMNVAMSVIGQDQSLSIDDAAQLVADTRAAALAMFPDKEDAYNMLYRPRLQRLMRERYRIQ